MIPHEIHSFASRMQYMPESFIREILKVSIRPDIISFAGGLPNPDLFPVDEMRNAAEKVFTSFGRETLQYSTTEGYLPLRNLIASRYSHFSRQSISAEQVLITSGSQQGLDLAGKVFINEGDKILMEGPTYLGAIQAFSCYLPQFCQIPATSGAIDKYMLSRIIKEQLPKLFYFVPNFQNPTGNTYDLDMRLHIVSEAKKNKMLLIEDDPYGELSYDGHRLPALHSLLPNQTLLLGSFSKIISPGLRLGWAIASPAIIKKMTVAKQASDLHTSFLSQRLIYQYLEDNNLENHLEKIRKFYNQQCQYMMEKINCYFPSEVKTLQPKGGMFAWSKLPEGINATRILQKAIKKNILFVPGEHFYTSRPELNTMRMNFSNPSVIQMKTGMETLGKLIKEEMAFVL